MRTIQIKRCRYLKILILLLLGMARLQGYGQNPLSRTPYPIIFVHGLTGDETTWRDNSYDIIDFLRDGTTPLREEQILNITLDKIRSTTTLSNTKEEDVELFTKNPLPSDLYIINFNVHANNTIPKGCIGNVLLDAPILATDDKIAVVDADIFQVGDIIRIQNEFMQVTDNSGSILTVKRNILGTEATFHFLPNVIYNLSNESNQAAIAKQGYGLKLAIDAVKAANPGVEKVILVGHSMGGLAIREYIRSYYNHVPYNNSNDVAKIVTIGTPHYGSNLSDIPVQYLVGTDGRSDAVRDLRSSISYKSDDVPGFVGASQWLNHLGIFLHGGPENILSGYYSKDVNCNGSETDIIKGINDFSLCPFPEEISKTWIASDRFGNSDGVVLTKSQYIYSGDTIMTHDPHNSSLILPLSNDISEPKDIYALIRGLDEPDEPELAYEIGENSTNKGFITFIKNFDDNDVADRFDFDWFKVNISKAGLFKINIDASSYTGIGEIDLYKGINEDPVKTITNILEAIEYNIEETGTYYIRIKGVPSLSGSYDHASYKYPYTLKTQLLATPAAAMAVSPTNLQYYDVVMNIPKSKTITLTNRGTTDILVTGIDLSDLVQFTASPMPPFAVTPELSQNVTITFNPTSIGAKVASLEITTNSLEIPTITVSLKGNGTDNETKVLVSSQTNPYNFGNTKINTSRSKTFTIQNTGSNALTISDLAIEGLNPDPYTITSAPTVPFDIGSGLSKQITIKFLPTSIGSTTASLTISNNSDNLSPKYSIDLLGNGTENYYTGSSNSLITLEYWFDDQYQAKINTPATSLFGSNLGAQIPTEGLTTGLHSVNIRYQDIKGKWSSIVSEFFHKLPVTPVGSPRITASEYWFDDGFASKVSTAITSGQTITANGGFDVSDLTNGLHSYHVRYKDDAGQWSSVVSEFFQKLPVAQVGSRNITASEYWFDDDFANKVSAAITPGQTISLSGGFDVSSLVSGLHSYHVRYKDDAGQWSSVISEFFQKLPVTAAGSRTITTCQYWFDDGFTSKVSTAITPGQIITANGGFEVGSLANGLHSYHVRYKDDAGQWSSVVSEFFQKLPVAQAGSRNITASEYWFDDDFANKVSAAITPGQTISLSGGFDVSSLASGLHSYHVRYKDDAGQWSSVVSEFFQKLPVTAAGSRTITTSQYWFDDGFASKVTTAITPGQTITANGGFEVGSLANGLHSYHVRYKDDAGQWSSVVSEFFQKLPLNSAQNNLIITYRYWFDSNNQAMITVNLPDAVTPYQLVRNINTCSLTDGNHTIHFQFKDSNHLWSAVTTDAITKSGVIPVPEITASGAKTFCQGNSVTLTSSVVESYLWSNGATTQSIVVTESGNYSVTVNKEIGCESTSEATAIVVNPLPKSAGVISGNTNVVKNQANVIYSVSAIADASSYIWTLPAGATGTSATNSISVSFGNDSVSGDIKVKGSNSCGNGAESVLAISLVSVITQDITLNIGWNIISANVSLSALNLKAIFQPLIDAGKLKKVMDETGKTIENLGGFGGWINNIGNLLTSEGYKVNVTAASVLSLEGAPVTLPLDINLNTGWNIVSYSSASAQNAKALFQSLIDAGKLKKVMDEAGKTIENLGGFGGWINNIGNLLPGKGYKVNVTSNCILTIPSDGTKSTVFVPELLASEHFKPVFIGNGTDHTSINLVNLQTSGLRAGDEIGVFDGKHCVGSATIGAEQLMAGNISIPASANDELSETVNGFTEGHPIELQLHRDAQTYPLQWIKVSGSESFEKNGSLVAQVNVNNLSAFQITEESTLFKCYPNPFTHEITIEVLNSKEMEITVEIYNMAGQRIKSLFKGTNNDNLILKWNGTNDSGQKVSSGVYLGKVNGMSKQVIFGGGNESK